VNGIFFKFPIIYVKKIEKEKIPIN